MFNRGFTLFRVRGIPVRIDLTLLLFLPYVAFVASHQFVAFARALEGPGATSMRVPPIVWGAVLAIGLFVSVLLHELAHSLVALRSGGRVQSITLMMLGGVTRMDTEVRPEREAWMAFAGPLASFGIAVAAWLVYRFVPLPAGPTVAIAVFAATNAILGAFNLLPAFPMDGGRVLRGLLAPRLGRPRATRIAAQLGKAMALFFLLFGLWTFNLVLILIAVFVYLGATAETARAEQQDVLRGIPVVQYMSDRLGVARVDETAAEVAGRLLRNNLVGAKIVEPDPDGVHARTVGIVTVWDLTRGAVRSASTTLVGAAMRTDLPTVHSYDDGTETVDALTTGHASAVVVVDETNQVVGLVTPADLQRAASLRALSLPPPARPTRR